MIINTQTLRWKSGKTGPGRGKGVPIKEAGKHTYIQIAFSVFINSIIQFPNIQIYSGYLFQCSNSVCKILLKRLQVKHLCTPDGEKQLPAEKETVH